MGRSTPSVILIRHADVASSRVDDPALSAAGSARAQELRHVLRDLELDAIYVTRWQRTQQTAAAVAADFGLTPEQIDAAADVVVAIVARPVCWSSATQTPFRRSSRGWAVQVAWPSAHPSSTGYSYCRMAA